MNKNIKIGVIGVITAAVLGYFYINQSADEPEKTVEVVEEVKTVQEKNVEEVQKETTILNPIVIVEKRSFTAEESSALISALEKKNEEEQSDVEEQNVGVEQEGQSGILQLEKIETDKAIEEETINADGDIKEAITESVQEVQEDREHYHENGHHQHHTEDVTTPSEASEEAQEDRGHYHEDGTYHAEPHTEDVTNTSESSESVETPQEESKF